MNYPSTPPEEVAGVNVNDVDYNTMTLKDLKNIANNNNIEGYSTMNKAELIGILKG